MACANKQYLDMVEEKIKGYDPIDARNYIIGALKVADSFKVNAATTKALLKIRENIRSW